jgi:hypothetical protein
MPAPRRTVVSGLQLASGNARTGGRDITFRNGSIVGFYMGIYATETNESRGNLVGEMHVEDSLFMGINIACTCSFPIGTGTVVRKNSVQNVGESHDPIACRVRHRPPVSAWWT